MLYLYTVTPSPFSPTYLVIADQPEGNEPNESQTVLLGSTPQTIYDAYMAWASLLLHADGGLNLDGGPADPSPPP